MLNKQPFDFSLKSYTSCIFQSFLISSLLCKLFLVLVLSFERSDLFQEPGSRVDLDD
jgi:hypothetical protein